MNDENSNPPNDWLAPEEAGAVERCPICERLNSPGACDTCDHFFGSYWDGEIIWSKAFDEFSIGWANLSELVHDLEESLGKSWGELLELAKAGQSASKLLAVDPSNFNASRALMKLVDFGCGPTIVTDGMVSGQGHSLYIQDSTAVPQTIEAIRVIRKNLEGLRPAE
jgi:hypothetical protein